MGFNQKDLTFEELLFSITQHSRKVFGLSAGEMEGPGPGQKCQNNWSHSELGERKPSSHPLSVKQAQFTSTEQMFYLQGKHQSVIYAFQPKCLWTVWAKHHVPLLMTPALFPPGWTLRPGTILRIPPSSVVTCV